MHGQHHVFLLYIVFAGSGDFAQHRLHLFTVGGKSAVAYQVAMGIGKHMHIHILAQRHHYLEYVLHHVTVLILHHRTGDGTAQKFLAGASGGRGKHQHVQRVDTLFPVL